MSARAAGLTAWLGLIVLHLAWPLWLQPVRGAALGIALGIGLVPLLLPLIALRRGPGRALLWVGVLCLFYFCNGMVNAFSPAPARIAGFVEIALCLIVIGTLGWRARGYKRRPRH